MVELSLVVTLLALLVPAVYLWWRSMESSLHAGTARVEAAEATRTIAEELRRDLFTLGWREPGALVLAGDRCASVEYLVEDRRLVRRADERCGGTRTLATRVASLTRTAWGVEVVFADGTAMRIATGREP